MVVPSYYENFRCIADKCRHSCCIGWEIDIDDETLALYRSETGAFGKRLNENISPNPAHFNLCGDERCPFLNEKGLCDIILEKGEGYLCQICREHPRFYNEWPGMTEAGLGLCCEEAARLILSEEKPFTLISDGSQITDPDAQELYDLRKTLISEAFHSSDPDKAVLAAAGAEIDSRSIQDWAEFYLDLERLDEIWTDVLEKLRNSSAVSIKNIPDTAYRNLLAYFLYRHVPEAMDDDDVSSKAAFAVLSCRMISALYSAGCGDFYDLARMYSSEIEYSLENLSALYDELWDSMQ